MKRRTFLQSVGVGGIGAGTLVGTGSYSEIRSQRRAKIEVAEKEVRVTAISFIAFCPKVSTQGINDQHITMTITDRDENENPIGIRWTMPGSQTYTGELILKGGAEWYRFEIGDQNTGTARMGDGELFCDDAPSRCQPPGEDYVRCPRSPCLGEQGTKFDYDGDEDDFTDPETTQPTCPGE